MAWITRAVSRIGRYILSACVTWSTRTKYIGERLPLEASHCVLEHVLRLSTYRTRSSSIAAILSQIVAICLLSWRFAPRCRAHCLTTFDRRRSPRLPPSTTTGWKKKTEENRRCDTSNRTSSEDPVEILEAILSADRDHDSTHLSFGETSRGSDGQRGDPIDGGGDGADNRRHCRAACSQQEERADESRLSRIFGQVRRVSGE